MTMTVTGSARKWQIQQRQDFEVSPGASISVSQTFTFNEDLTAAQFASSLFPQRSDREVEQIFNALSARWLRETSIESDPERIVFHPAYQQIIGLGPRALSFILRDLKEYHHHWFWALSAITGEDAGEGQTTVGGAAEAWLAWGRNHGLIDG